MSKKKKIIIISICEIISIVILGMTIYFATKKVEEYKGVSYFLIDFENELSEEETNTRFYFDGEDLKKYF